MIECQATQSANPIAVAREIRPDEWNRAQPMTGGGLCFVLINTPPEASVLWLPLVQGARPLAPSRVVEGEPADLGDSMDFERSWRPTGTVSFLAEKMEWPREDIEY